MDWQLFLNPYEQTVNELKLKLREMRKQYRQTDNHAPIEFVTGRIKSVDSIKEKMVRRQLTEDRLDEMEDIAGVRIMCQFVEDIYTIVGFIKSRNDMSIVYEKDYIKNFKDSGYRSYHVIIKYPISSIAGSKEILCEIQIRTLAMNFWATIEHSLKYKYEHFIPENIAIRLRRAADAAFLLDQEMSEIREDIMKAQVMFHAKSVTLIDILDKVKQLHSLGEHEKAIMYQEKLDKIDTQTNIIQIVAIKKEVEDLLEKYENI